MRNKKDILKTIEYIQTIVEAQIVDLKVAIDALDKAYIDIDYEHYNLASPNLKRAWSNLDWYPEDEIGQLIATARHIEEGEGIEVTKQECKLED